MEEIIKELMEMKQLLQYIEVKGDSVPAMFGVMQRTEKLIQFFQQKYTEEMNQDIQEDK